MEYNPIQTMYEEHNLISMLEYCVYKLYHTLQEDSKLYENNVIELTVFLNEYADKIHHRKEEEILFPALLDCPEFTLNELLLELKVHHVRFREFSRKIKENIALKNYAQSYVILKEYCNELLDHIAIENDELFVLTETLLNQEELERIFFKFQDVDREVGLERKAELESIITKWSFLNLANHSRS